MKKAPVFPKKTFGISSLGIIIAYVLVFAGLSIASPNFLSLSNFMVLIRQAVFTAIVGLAMTFVISMGAIDLSVGSVVGISSMLAGVLVLAGWPVGLVVLMALLLGAVIGLVNGFLVTKMRIAYFIATLATMSILRGFIYVYSKGIPLYGLGKPDFQVLGQGYLGFLPVPVLITLILICICYYLFNRTRFGRYTVSIGSNETAAEMVGIKINRIKVLVFTFSGLMCSIAGVILASRSEASIPDAGSGYEMDAIAATVIGGTSMSGGKGNIIGTVFGAVLISTIRNGLSFLNINTLWNQVVVGTFILLTVAFDGLTSRRSVARAN